MRPPALSMKSYYFKNIQLLRAFAALSVVFYHIVELLPWKEFPSTPEPLRWIHVGWMGVDLFFVISGFVIALSAIRLLREGQRPFARTYLRHRLARIAPLYYVTAVVFLLFITPTLLTVPTRDYHLTTHLFFLHNLFSDTHGSINGANWSVGTEMQFYLLILILARWLSRANPWRVLLASIAIACIWRGTVFWLVTENGGGTLLKFIYSTQVFGMLDEFGFGVFLARLLLDGWPPLPGRWQERLSPPGAATHGSLFWLVAALVTFLVSWKLFWSHATYWDSWKMVTFWRTSLGLAFCCVVGTAVFIRFPAWVERFILPPFYYLGEISYGLYLWHLPVILALKEAGILNPLHFSLTALCFLIGFSAFSWHFLERPLIRKYR